MARSDTFAGLDIGTTKTCAVVASTGPTGSRSSASAKRPRPGMRKGVVTDLEETVKSIEAATERAERMAGVHISHVYVGVTGEHVASTNNRGVVAVSGDEREVVHRRRPAGRRRQQDHQSRGRPPDHPRPAAPLHGRRPGRRHRSGRHVGRPARSRHAHRHRRHDLHRQRAQVRSPRRARAGRHRFEPLASRRRRRCCRRKSTSASCLLDIGGGTTDIAVYSRRRRDPHVRPIPVGGNILTNDIALGLKTTFAEAENIKRTYGAGVAARRRGRGDVSPSRRSTGAARARSRPQQLRAIVVPRVARDCFRMAKQNIADSVPRDRAGRGRAHRRRRALARDRAIAAEFFGLPARIGVPQSIGGLTDAVKQPRVRDRGRTRALRPAWPQVRLSTSGRERRRGVVRGVIELARPYLGAEWRPSPLERRPRYSSRPLGGHTHDGRRRNVSFPNTPRRSR